MTSGSVAHTVTGNRAANTLLFATGNQVSRLTIDGGILPAVQPANDMHPFHLYPDARGRYGPVHSDRGMAMRDHSVRSPWRVLLLLMAGILLWPAAARAQCTNCTTTVIGSDVVLTFTSGAGTFTPPAGVTSVAALVVGGGGGGGFPVDRTGGGGGAGGLISNASFAVAGTVTVTVGAGGNGGAGTSGATAGGNSVFGTLTAVGGGRGGTGPGTGGVYATAGGSGGGGYHNSSDSGKAGTAGQGNAGGSGYDSANTSNGFKAGGGGGAAAAGTTATATVNGAGGAGLQNSISGAATFYAGGGGGGIQVYTGTTLGGSGVGGNGGANGTAGTAGTANRGGGGGGGSQNISTSATGNGGAGGSGIVVIRYSLTLSQTMSPDSTADCTSLGGGGANWSNTTRAISSDNSYATATVDGTTTDPLRCLDFRFTIPLTATVAGIEVFIERDSSRTTDGGSRDASLFLVKAGATVGANRATTTTYTTTDTVEGHGSSSDLWGTTWTPAEINAANFGTVFTATKPSAAGNSHLISVDHIFITVHYTIPSPVVTPGAFNAFETTTAASAITGKIYTKRVGTGFSLDIVAISGGAQQAGFTNTVSVQLVANTTGAALGADNCPTAFTTVQTVSPDPTIAGGRSTASFAAVASAYQDVRVRVQYPAGSPTVTSCSTDNVSIRPLAFSSVTAPVLTNSGSSGDPKAKAGDSFTLHAVAGAGYNGMPVIDGTKITAHAGGVQNGSVGGAFPAATALTGTTIGTSFTYSEVGNFRFEVNGVYDSSFTSVDAPGVDCTDDFSNTLVGGRYGCRFGNSSASAAIGRFTPDHFDVALNAPNFVTGCTAGGFTYVGQTFGYTVQPEITITAKNAAGLGNATTRNYHGPSWWKVTSGSLTGKTYTTLAGALDTSAISGADPVIRYGGDGLPGEPPAGEGTLAFNAGTGFFFTRSTPSAPFDAEISLAINVIDSDNIAHAGNPARFGAATAGNGMAFNNGKPMRFGRLHMENASGSPLVPLTLQMEVQYWSGTSKSFITHTADACTTVAVTGIAMGGYTGSLTDSPKCLTAISGGGVFSAGHGPVLLSAPGDGVNGGVTLTANLNAPPSGDTCAVQGAAPSAATAGNQLYLRDGAAFVQNPTARATFGVRSGSEEVVDVRENY